MAILPLSPLPSLRDEAMEHRSLPMDAGFVDESVVLALATGACRQRSDSEAAWPMVADAGDFAGWGCAAVAIPAAPPQCQRRAAAPELGEPGIGEPHRGSHRWWLAGLAGALTTLLASALLLTLAARHQVEESELTIIRPAPAAPLPAAKPELPRPSSELTGLTGDE